MLREFKALPTEERVRNMKERDLLWCALNLMLDDEEALEALCPACRAQAEGGACPVCGGQTAAGQRERNAAFDPERFERMKGGETP